MSAEVKSVRVSWGDLGGDRMTRWRQLPDESLGGASAEAESQVGERSAAATTKRREIKSAGGGCGWGGWFGGARRLDLYGCRRRSSSGSFVHDRRRLRVPSVASSSLAATPS